MCLDNAADTYTAALYFSNLHIRETTLNGTTAEACLSLHVYSVD